MIRNCRIVVASWMQEVNDRGFLWIFVIFVNMRECEGLNVSVHVNLPTREQSLGTCHKLREGVFAASVQVRWWELLWAICNKLATNLPWSILLVYTFEVSRVYRGWGRWLDKSVFCSTGGRLGRENRHFWRTYFMDGPLPLEVNDCSLNVYPLTV